MRKIMHIAPTLRVLLCYCADSALAPAHTAEHNGEPWTLFAG